MNRVAPQANSSLGETGVTGSDRWVPTRPDAHPPYINFTQATENKLVPILRCAYLEPPSLADAARWGGRTVHNLGALTILPFFHLPLAN